MKKQEELFNDAAAFLGVVDGNRDIVSVLCHKIGNCIKAQEKLNRFLANGPTISDIDNGITAESLEEEVEKKERDFKGYMFRLSADNGGFLNYIHENETERLINETIEVLYVLRLCDCLYQAA